MIQVFGAVKEFTYSATDLLYCRRLSTSHFEVGDISIDPSFPRGLPCVKVIFGLQPTRKVSIPQVHSNPPPTLYKEAGSNST